MVLQLKLEVYVVYSDISLIFFM